MALISLRSVAPARDICSLAGSWLQPPQPISSPVPIYPGQSFAPLYGFLPDQRTEIPAIELRLGFIDDPTIIVQSGFDGLIVDKAGVAVAETSFYTDIFRKNLQAIDLEVEGGISDVEDIFVAFDGSWWVYYHWLLFCLGSAGVAQALLPGATLIAVPDWQACAPKRPSAIPKRVFNEVGRVVDPTRLLRLSDGTYRARRAYFLYVENGQPSDVAMHPLYREIFSELKTETDQATPSRLFVSRGGRGDSSRVTLADEKVFEGAIVDYHLQTVHLENLSFQAQIDRFSKASLIVAAHGSGLANLVFAPPTAKVLELQTEFAAPGLLLPWFYRLAAASGLAYAFLNREAGDFQAERMRSGLEALGVSRPPSNPISKGLRIAVRWLNSTNRQLGKSVFGRLETQMIRLLQSLRGDV